MVAAGRLTECGEALVAAVDGELDEDGSVAVTAALAERVSGVLVAMPCTVIVQSDLTALVSGEPTTRVSRVLSAAAQSESRGTAALWRFSAVSVRKALDAGRMAEELIGELAVISDRPLPQPLEYLVRDVARKHGQSGCAGCDRASWRTRSR